MKEIQVTAHTQYAKKLEAQKRVRPARENYRYAARLEVEAAEECVQDAKMSFGHRFSAASLLHDAHDPRGAERELVEALRLARPCGVRILRWVEGEVEKLREKFAGTEDA